MRRGREGGGRKERRKEEGGRGGGRGGGREENSKQPPKTNEHDINQFNKKVVKIKDLVEIISDMEIGSSMNQAWLKSGLMTVYSKFTDMFV